jgi:hypothetical protein
MVVLVAGLLVVTNRSWRHQEIPHLEVHLKEIMEELGVLTPGLQHTEVAVAVAVAGGVGSQTHLSLRQTVAMVVNGVSTIQLLE